MKISTAKTTSKISTKYQNINIKIWKYQQQRLLAGKQTWWAHSPPEGRAVLAGHSGFYISSFAIKWIFNLHFTFYIFTFLLLSLHGFSCCDMQGLISNPSVWRDRFVLNSKYTNAIKTLLSRTNKSIDNVYCQFFRRKEMWVALRNCGFDLLVPPSWEPVPLIRPTNVEARISQL